MYAYVYILCVKETEGKMNGTVSGGGGNVNVKNMSLTVGDRGDIFLHKAGFVLHGIDNGLNKAQCGLLSPYLPIPLLLCLGSWFRARNVAT